MDDRVGAEPAGCGLGVGRGADCGFSNMRCLLLRHFSYLPEESARRSSQPNVRHGWIRVVPAMGCHRPRPCHAPPLGPCPCSRRPAEGRCCVSVFGQRWNMSCLPGSLGAVIPGNPDPQGPQGEPWNYDPHTWGVDTLAPFPVGQDHSEISFSTILRGFLTGLSSCSSL